MPPPPDPQQRKLLAALERNRARRETAEAKLEATRAEMGELLIRGKAAGISVAALARAAGVSRETAHKVLRRGGRDA